MHTIYFAGGNTFEGFKGFYDGLLARARRAVILKGGPGVGKSTLMRRMGEAWEAAGDAVEYYLCSGDPDSVDAVACPARGLLILDGTSPHIVDPALPGARDSLVNLGDCLREDKLRARLDSIDGLCREISRRFARAYSLLRSAHGLREASARLLREALDERAMGRVVTRLFERAVWVEGETRTLFAEAITCQGVLRHLSGALGECVVSIEAPWGFDMSAALSPLEAHARHMGYGATVLRDALDARVPAHIVLGGVAFSGAGGGERVEAPLLGSRLTACQDELAFDHAVYDLLLNQAIDALADAKRLHDDLECIYVNAMDYKVWDERYARVASMMAETGSSTTGQPAEASASAV